MAAKQKNQPKQEAPVQRQKKKPKVANVNKLLDTSRQLSETETKRLKCAEFALEVYLMHNTCCPQLPPDSKGLSEAIKQMSFRRGDDKNPDLVNYRNFVGRVIHRCNLEGVAVNEKLAEEAAQAAVIKRQDYRLVLLHLAEKDPANTWPLFQPLDPRSKKPSGKPTPWRYRDFNHTPSSLAERLLQFVNSKKDLVLTRSRIEKAAYDAENMQAGYKDSCVVLKREVVVASEDFFPLLLKAYEEKAAKKASVSA